jgi:hypothetical protein
MSEMDVRLATARREARKQGRDEVLAELRNDSLWLSGMAMRHAADTIEAVLAERDKS